MTSLENFRTGQLPQESWRQSEYKLIACEAEDGYKVRAYYIQGFGTQSLIRVDKTNMVYLVGQGLVANLRLRKVLDTVQVVGVGKSIGLYPKVRVKV